MAEPILQTQDLTREYRVGRTPLLALDHVNLTVGRGEFVAIMGPSGCGKSTLLNLMGGLDRPTDGKVLLETHDLSQYNEEQLAALRREKLGYIFQHHDLFPVLTARENIEFPLLLDGLSRTERAERTEALLALLGLEDQAEQLPDELSGGQQQRVGIARALANRPTLLFADEPTGNLDSATATEVLDVLIDLIHQQHLTLVMVTHDPQTVTQADRIIYLKDGRLADSQGGQL
jgi:putative ABC transport system ATP-binding protein